MLATVIEVQRPLAVYFSEFRIDGTRKDLYTRLLNYFERSNLIEACLFSSLNYDAARWRALRLVQPTAPRRLLFLYTNKSRTPAHLAVSD